MTCPNDKELKSIKTHTSHQTYTLQNRVFSLFQCTNCGTKHLLYIQKLVEMIECLQELVM